MTPQINQNQGEGDAPCRALDAVEFPPSVAAQGNPQEEKKWRIELARNCTYILNERGETIADLLSQWAAKTIVAAHNASLVSAGNKLCFGEYYCPKCKVYWTRPTSNGLCAGCDGPLSQVRAGNKRETDSGLKEAYVNAGDMFYVASKVTHAATWRDLRSQGVSIVASWIDEAGEGQTADYSELAERCISEIRRSAALILYCEPGEVLKGALIEAGIALALGRPVRCVGTCDSISRVFRKHPLWSEYESIDEARNTPSVPEVTDSDSASGVSSPKPPVSQQEQEKDTARLEHLLKYQHRVPVSGTFFFDGIRNGENLSREAIDAAMEQENK